MAEDAKAQALAMVATHSRQTPEEKRKFVEEIIRLTEARLATGFVPWWERLKESKNG